MAQNRADNEKAVALLFGILFVLYIIAQIILFLIGLARAVFWISIVVSIFAFISSIVLFLIWIFNRDDPWKEDYWMFSGAAFILVILLYFIAGGAYQFGYSEEAIKTKMQAEGYIDWYNQFTNIPGQAIEETITNLCKDPNYPCESAKAGYTVYQEVSGFKDVADIVSKILKII